MPNNETHNAEIHIILETVSMDSSHRVEQLTMSGTENDRKKLGQSKFFSCKTFKITHNI